MQLRGPAPKGWKTIGSILLMSSNLAIEVQSGYYLLTIKTRLENADENAPEQPIVHGF